MVSASDHTCDAGATERRRSDRAKGGDNSVNGNHVDRELTLARVVTRKYMVIVVHCCVTLKPPLSKSPFTGEPTGSIVVK